jgi:hypothetical protein
MAGWSEGFASMGRVRVGENGADGQFHLTFIQWDRKRAELFIGMIMGSGNLRGLGAFSPLSC